MKDSKAPNSRPTIGLLTYGIEDTISQALWTGMLDVARERGANLICFPGGILRLPSELEAQRNMLYDLAGADNVDGLAIWGGALTHAVDVEDARAFYERYRPMPIVSVGFPLEDIPSVLVDNYGSMWEAIVHLIQVHNCRRIAFIRGPEGHPEAEDRYRAYVDVLAEHGLPLAPERVAPGDNQAGSGAAAVRLLLDERGLDPQAGFDAVVAANDNMALGALEALRERGIRVPAEMALVGFDDTEPVRSTAPPITTVRYSFYKVGQQSAETLLTLLEGENVPRQIILPLELIVRQSCGCLDPMATEAAAGPVTAAEGPFETAFTTRREKTISNIVEAAGSPGAQAAPEQVGQLVDAFAAELGGPGGENISGGFLVTLDEALQHAMATGSEVTPWHRALSALRRHALPYLNDARALSQAEDLWQQARVIIGEAARREQLQQRLRAGQQATTLRTISQRLITTFDVADLVGVAAEGLPQLGIPSCYLSLYEGHGTPPDRSNLILAYDENGRIEVKPDARRFLSRQLVPDEFLPQDRPYSMVIEPLFFQEEQLGLVLFEAGPRDGSVYEALRGQLSSALKGALLLEAHSRTEKALESAYTEVEKQVQERTTELERETAERERLQEEIIGAQRRALQELSTPIIPIMDRIIVMPLVGSIDSMRARDITRALLAGIRQHRAKVVILDVTGVPIVDSGVADHLNKTIQAARLKGARTVVTGISDAVAETIVDLGIDWTAVETMADLRTGLVSALSSLGIKLTMIQ